LFILQNGLYSQEAFKQMFSANLVSRCVINVAASVIEPGLVLHKADEIITIQDSSPAAHRLFDYLRQVQVETKLSTEINKVIWHKLCWNAAFNSVTALSRLTTGPVLADPDGHDLIKALCEEVCALAAANQINLPADKPTQTIQVTREQLGDITTSTLEDVKQQKPIEYSAIVGDLIEEAKRLQIQVPHLKTVFTLLKLLNSSMQNSHK
jgi:2-dehydropantoate 2-reductase